MIDTNTPARRPASRATTAAPVLLTPAGMISGTASLFDMPDSGGDIVAPGAFTRCLARRGSNGIRMLFQHDPREPVGIWTSIVETSSGLHVTGQLALANSRVRDLHALIEAGAIDGLSIGFKAVRSERASRSGLRRLIEIDLWEISIVTFPMLPQAKILRKKSSSCPHPRCRPHTAPVTPATLTRLADLAAQVRTATRQRARAPA